MSKDYPEYTHSSPTVREYYAVKRVRELEKEVRRSRVVAYITGALVGVGAWELVHYVAGKIFN